MYIGSAWIVDITYIHSNLPRQVALGDHRGHARAHDHRPDGDALVLSVALRGARPKGGLMDSSTGLVSRRHRDDRSMLNQLPGRSGGGNLRSSPTRRVLLQGGTGKNRRRYSEIIWRHCSAAFPSSRAQLSTIAQLRS